MCSKIFINPLIPYQHEYVNLVENRGTESRRKQYSSKKSLKMTFLQRLIKENVSRKYMYRQYIHVYQYSLYYLYNNVYIYNHYICLNFLPVHSWFGSQLLSNNLETLRPYHSNSNSWYVAVRISMQQVYRHQFMPRPYRGFSGKNCFLSTMVEIFHSGIVDGVR